MAEKHFYEQQKFTQSYLIDYFQENIPDFSKIDILEIGCAEGGFMDIMSKMGIHTIGIELEEDRVITARQKNPNLNIILGDITDEKIVETVGKTFPLVIMRDVIEHIPDREAAFENVTKLLDQNGYLYVTFPPRFSAFAGHQQNYHSVLKLVPYLHLFPKPAIRMLGKIFNESPQTTELVILNYHVGLTIRQFEKYYKEFRLTPVRKDLFFFRPIYQIRFNVKPVKFPNIPVIREVLAFGCEYLLQKSG